MPLCINPCTALARMEFVQRWDQKGYLEVARMICMLGLFGIITYGAFNSTSSGISGFLMMGLSMGAMTFRYLENKQKERRSEPKREDRYQQIETIAFTAIALLGLISLTTGIGTCAFAFWTIFSLVMAHSLIKWAAGSLPKTCGSLPVSISKGLTEFKGLVFGYLPSSVQNALSSSGIQGSQVPDPNSIATPANAS